MRYKQFTNQGCLPTCLMMLAGMKHTKTKELELIYSGFGRLRETYSLGIIEAFSDTSNVKLSLAVDNSWYVNELSQLCSSNLVSITHTPITLTFLQAREVRYIAYIDNYEFGEYSHSPHFVVCVPHTNAKVIMHDPWTGKSSVVTLKRLHRAMMSLKNYLKYCPLVIELFENVNGA